LTAIARVAREQRKTLAQWLAHVAEVEDAEQRVAEHPTPAVSAGQRTRLPALGRHRGMASHHLPSARPDMDPSILFR
jgi:hypothetical protein